MNNLLFKYLSKQIIIDVFPSKFIVTRADKDLNFLIPTFVYLDNSGSKSLLLSIGEEPPSEHSTNRGIVRIDVFDAEPLPPGTIFSRDDLIEFIFEFGIGRCFEMSLLPQLRPVVFILGVDRFNALLENPREVFEKSAKLGGAGIVVFDKTEL